MNGAIELSRGLLRRPELVAACAARDFGALLALVKKYGGISQVRLAAALDMTPSRVGEIVRGQRRVTSIDVVERISDRLAIPGAMLGLAPRPWEVGRGQGATDGGLEELGAFFGVDEPDLTADAALRIAHSWLVVEPPQSAELRAGRHVGYELVSRIETRVRHLRRMDDVIGGLDSHAIMTREVEVTAHLVREAAYTEAVHAALLRAIAELCQVTGWVLDDAGRHERAIRYFLAGARAAEEAGDLSLAANLLSTLSYSQANTGRQADAVLLARSAVMAGGLHAAPVGGALLWDRVAWTHAKNGEAELCRQALGAAEDAYARGAGDEKPAWAYWFDQNELDVMAGRCLTQLDEPARAEPLIRNAVAGYDASRSREVALYRSWLAEAYAKTGDVDRACGETMRILDAMEGVNSARVDDRVRVLRRLLRPYANVQAVRELEERMSA